jgi:type I restriction enzyme S subunit
MSWKETTWENVVVIKNGKNQKKVANPLGKYPIYGSGGIMGRADDYLCEAGSTIIGRKGSINKPIYVNEKYWNVDTAFGLHPKQELDNRFFYYFCTTYDFLKHNKTVTIPSLTKTDLLKIKIPLPPLPQQQKIANILDAADALRQKDKALLAKYDELTQALFLDMFGDPFINQFNHPYKKLATLIKSKSDLVDGPFGSSVNTKVDYIDNGEIPVIRTKNVSIDNCFVTNDLKFMKREKYLTIIRSQVLPGDIILTKVGTIGNVCIFPDNYKEAVLSTTGSCRIRINEDLINKKYFLL